MTSFGFILTRKVIDTKTNAYWQEACRCIRRFYEQPILILDDSSDPEFLNGPLVENCSVISNVYPGSGEIAAYYYFYSLHPFDQAIILHDSVFVQRKIEFTFSPCTFLWSIPHTYDEPEPTLELINQLDHGEEIRRLFLKPSRWKGCFGLMASVSWTWIESMERRFQLFERLVPKIQTRTDRMRMERIFGCVCYRMGLIPIQFGDILEYCQWGRTFDNYLRGENAHLPLCKVWTGR